MEPTNNLLQGELSSMKKFGPVGNAEGEFNICLKPDTNGRDHELWITVRDSKSPQEFTVAERYSLSNGPIVLFVNAWNNELTVIEQPMLSRLKFTASAILPVGTSKSSSRLTIQKRRKDIPKPGGTSEHIIVGLDDPNLILPLERNLTWSDVSMGIKACAGVNLSHYAMISVLQDRSILFSTEYGHEVWASENKVLSDILEEDNGLRIFYWNHQPPTP